MAWKGRVRERAYRGAKPDGQLDLEARFRDPPARLKPLDLPKLVYFGEENPYVQAGF
jgi:hypothetical protein